MEIILNHKSSICDIIANYMSKKQDAVATLKQIYAAVKEKWAEIKSDKKVPSEETIRAAIYKSPDRYDFERIGKGLYLLKGVKTASLIINGDGRQLREINDSSIDCIITDHPWEDKKAHRSGDQKGFAEYNTFQYTQKDFDAKYRILKEGCFLAEFLPVESATNWKYLTLIKQFAEKSGFKYYAQILWRNTPEGKINTGRTTKGVQQILIFTKGKARRLAPKGKPYMTKHILQYEVGIPCNKGKAKTHQAEKPIPLYEYLIEQLTEEEEIVLDQFGGSMNLLKAANNTNRWGVAYEISSEFVKNACTRWEEDSIALFEPNANVGVNNKQITAMNNKIKEKANHKQTVKIEINNITKEETDFQVQTLKKIAKFRPELLTKDEKQYISNLENKSYYIDSISICKLFDKVNKAGYKGYKKDYFDFSLEEYPVLKKINKQIDDLVNNMFAENIRSYFCNYKYELQMFAEYVYKVEHKTDVIDLLYNTEILNRYINFLQKQQYQKFNRSLKILVSISQRLKQEKIS